MPCWCICLLVYMVTFLCVFVIYTSGLQLIVAGVYGNARIFDIHQRFRKTFFILELLHKIWSGLGSTKGGWREQGHLQAWPRPPSPGHPQAPKGARARPAAPLDASNCSSPGSSLALPHAISSVLADLT